MGLVIGAIALAGAVAGGISEKKAAEKQADMVEADAEREADMRRGQARGAAKRQKLTFIKSGINIGTESPLLQLAETRRKGESEAGFISERAGRQASGFRRSGRQALTSGILSGISQGVGSASGGFQ